MSTTFLISGNILGLTNTNAGLAWQWMPASLCRRLEARPRVPQQRRRTLDSVLFGLETVKCIVSRSRKSAERWSKLSVHGNAALQCALTCIVVSR